MRLTSDLAGRSLLLTLVATAALVGVGGCGGGANAGTHRLLVELRFRNYGGEPCSTRADLGQQFLIRDASNKILASAPMRGGGVDSPVESWEISPDTSGDCVDSISLSVTDSPQYQFSLTGFSGFPVQSRQDLQAEQWHMQVSLDVNGRIVVKSP